MITAKCPHCQAGIQGEDQFAGRVVACPKCKKQVQMPTVPKPNVGTNPVVQSPRSAPKLPQNPVSQPDARAVMSKPGAADSDDGMSRQMKIAMIALPAVAVIVGAIFIWSFEKSRQEARRQEAQVAAQKIFDEAQQALGKNNIPEAVQKLKAYLSDENATQTSEAKKLLAEIELATSKNAALDTLVTMSQEDFQRFQQSHHYNDTRVTQPILAKQWNLALVQALPDAPKKREEAEARRLAELEKGKRVQAEREAAVAADEAAIAKEATKALPPEERFKKFVAMVTHEFPKNRRFAEDKWKRSGVEFSYDVQKTDSLTSPLAATLQIRWHEERWEMLLDCVLVCNYRFQGGEWVFGDHTYKIENFSDIPTDFRGMTEIDVKYNNRSLSDFSGEILRSSEKF